MAANLAGPVPSTLRPDKARVFRRVCLETSVLLLITIVAAAFTAWLRPPPPDDGVSELTLAQTRATFANEKILWVDARPSAAFATEHIPNAVWLAEDAWEDGLPGFVEAWSPDRPVIVYCGSESCGASRSVARRLKRELGVSRAFYLKGGWQTWKDETK